MSAAICSIPAVELCQPPSVAALGPAHVQHMKLFAHTCTAKQYHCRSNNNRLAEQAARLQYSTSRYATCGTARLMQYALTLPHTAWPLGGAMLVILDIECHTNITINKMAVMQAANKRCAYVCLSGKAGRNEGICAGGVCR